MRQAAITVFNAAYDDWIDHPDAEFAALMNQALADLRESPPSPAAGGEPGSSISRPGPM